MATVLQICRICLSVNVKMYKLKNTDVENIFKLLTQAYVDVEDRKPTTVCFLCYARLRQCNRLQQQATKSNELLEQLLKGGIMQATANAIINNQYTSQDLQVSSIYQLDYEPVPCKEVFLDPNVKANSQISVKEEDEAMDEGYNVTDCPDANGSKNFDPEDGQLLTSSNNSDEIKDIVLERNWIKLQEKENLCKEQSEIEVKNNHPLSSLTQMQQKENVSQNNEEVNGIHVKSERKLDKSGQTHRQIQESFVTMEHNFPKSINNGEDTEMIKINLKRKMEITKAFVPKKLYIQKRINNNDTEKKNINYKFQCNECGKQFSTQAILIDHILKCMKSAKTSLSNSLLMEESMLKILMYSCDICKFETNHRRSIETHLKMHNVTKFFSCHICEYRCVTKAQLKRHIITHTVEKSFSCNICDYRCSQKHHLKQHIMGHTGEKPFSCNICEYRGAYKGELTRHMKTHTGEKPFSCNICEYRGAYKGDLTRHMRTHTGDKPFACSVCEYRCARKAALKVHVRIHTGLKPFSCNICGYRFAQKTNIIRHLKTHRGEKPFFCNICEYRFTRKADLKSHIRLHAGEKPFSCNICEYKCARKTHLKSHVKIHTGLKPL